MTKKKAGSGSNAKRIGNLIHELAEAKIRLESYRADAERWREYVIFRAGEIQERERQQTKEAGMALYCLCGEQDNKLEEGRPLILSKRMKTERIGLEQYIRHQGEVVSRHHPNVDIFRCDHCGVAVARE